MLDADVIIGGERGNFDLIAWLNSRAGDEFEIAAVTIAELWHGVERAAEPYKSRRRNYLEAILAMLPVIAYTEETAREHARIWTQLEAEGKIIGAYDLIVSATALERGSAVATFNSRHFSSVPGLDVIVPQCD